MTEITIYDGNDTIGGNKIYVEEWGKGFFSILAQIYTIMTSFTNGLINQERFEVFMTIGT